MHRSSPTYGPSRPLGWKAAVLIALGWCAAFPVPGLGQSAPVTIVARAPDLVGRLPSDIELVLCVRDAERQRRSDAGRSVLQTFEGTEFFSDTAAAWVKLATLLGWTPEEAFIRLAGRRLVLALARSEGAADRPWAVLSDVNADVARRLVEVLRPAPRKTVAGQPILSLEDGRFEIAVFRSEPAMGKPGSAPHTLVLAPSGRGDLLDRIVQGLSGAAPGPVLGDSPELKEADRFVRGDIFVMAVRDAVGAREHFMLSATLVEDGWMARLRAEPGLLLRSTADPIDLWSARAIDALVPDAVALVMSDDAIALPFLGQLFMFPTLQESTDRLRGLVGGRMFLGLFRTGAAQEDGTPGLAIALGLEAPDIRALAASGDAVIGRFIGALEAGARAGEEDRPDFEGFMPEAPRVVPLHGPATTVWRPLLGPRPVMTWVYRQAAPDGAGWWLTAISPSDHGEGAAALTGRACELLARPDDGPDPRRRVNTGVVRVGELVRWLSDVHADPTGALAPLRCLESVRWDTWLVPDGRIEGTVRVITAPAR